MGDRALVPADFFAASLYVANEIARVVTPVIEAKIKAKLDSLAAQARRKVTAYLKQAPRALKVGKRQIGKVKKGYKFKAKRSKSRTPFRKRTLTARYRRSGRTRGRQLRGFYTRGINGRRLPIRYRTKSRYRLKRKRF